MNYIAPLENIPYVTVKSVIYLPSDTFRFANPGWVTVHIQYPAGSAHGVQLTGPGAYVVRMAVEGVHSRESIK